VVDVEGGIDAEPLIEHLLEFTANAVAVVTGRNKHMSAATKATGSRTSSPLRAAAIYRVPRTESLQDSDAQLTKPS
jgi:hypothetical protein